MTSYRGFLYVLLTSDELERRTLQEVYGIHALSSKDIIYRDKDVTLLKLPKFSRDIKI